MGQIWETEWEQGGIALQRSTNLHDDDPAPPAWRILWEDGRWQAAADQAAGIATLAYEARRAVAERIPPSGPDEARISAV